MWALLDLNFEFTFLGQLAWNGKHLLTKPLCLVNLSTGTVRVVTKEQGVVIKDVIKDPLD